MVNEVDLDRRLYRDWWGVAMLFGVVAGVGVVRAMDVLGMETALRWGVVATGVATFELGYLRRSLTLNHPHGNPSDLYGRLGVANFVTSIRGTCIAALAGFAVVSPTSRLAWLPAICYGFGVTLDVFDGALARTLDRRTVLGEKLDMAFDTTGFVIATVVAVRWGRLPIWYLAFPAARYVFKAACWRRERRGLVVESLPESDLRRYLAALQMAFITFALTPLVPVDLVFFLAPFTLLSSLTYFLRDYLVVTGRL